MPGGGSVSGSNSSDPEIILSFVKTRFLDQDWNLSHSGSIPKVENQGKKGGGNIVLTTIEPYSIQ